MASSSISRSRPAPGWVSGSASVAAGGAPAPPRPNFVISYRLLDEIPIEKADFVYLFLEYFFGYGAWISQSGAWTSQFGVWI